MNEEQLTLWRKHVEDHRQHRAEYLRLLHLDQDWSAGDPKREAKMKSHMDGLRQLMAECDAVLAVDALVNAMVEAVAA